MSVNAGPMVPGSHQVPYADCYRCPLKLEYPTCGVACADFAREYGPAVRVHVIATTRTVGAS